VDAAATEKSPKKVQAKQPKSSGNGRNRIDDDSSFIAGAASSAKNSAVNAWDYVWGN